MEHEVAKLIGAPPAIWASRDASMFVATEAERVASERSP